MRRSTVIAMLGVAVFAVILVIAVVRPQFEHTGTTTAEPAPVTKPADIPERKITATLFYVSENGVSLVPAQTEVAFGEPVSSQARHIVEAQVAVPKAPYVSAIPQGTKVRAVYVSDRGEAFVDVSREMVANHTGGALDELFAVYAIVNSLTVNLPAITRVQILVDGKEVDTLAGHVDLRQPLAKNMGWVAETKQD